MKKVHFINKTGVIVSNECIEQPYEVYWKRKEFSQSRNDINNKGFKEISLWMRLRLYFGL